jgi:hypothetical protein
MALEAPAPQDHQRGAEGEEDDAEGALDQQFEARREQCAPVAQGPQERHVEGDDTADERRQHPGEAGGTVGAGRLDEGEARRHPPDPVVRIAGGDRHAERKVA